MSEMSARAHARALEPPNPRTITHTKTHENTRTGALSTIPAHKSTLLNNNFLRTAPKTLERPRAVTDAAYTSWWHAWW